MPSIDRFINITNGVSRNILLGAGLSYAIKKKLFFHIPLVILFPSVYAGYNTYDNKDEIIKSLRDSFFTPDQQGSRGVRDSSSCDCSSQPSSPDHHSPMPSEHQRRATYMQAADSSDHSTTEDR
jgi:hypothetical protein